MRVSPAFARGSMLRVFYILGAVATLDRPTLISIVKITGLPKPTVSDIMNRLIEGEIPGLVMIKDSAVYRITDWGQTVNKDGVVSYYETFQSSD